MRNFSTEVFRHFKLSRGDAEQAADVLARSDLRGIDSHGVARLHTYFEMLELGRINPRPNVRVVREKMSVAFRAALIGVLLHLFLHFGSTSLSAESARVSVTSSVHWRSTVSLTRTNSRARSTTGSIPSEKQRLRLAPRAHSYLETPS